MTRRDFLWTPAIALASPSPSILVHEHIMVDFIGADQIRPGRYERDQVIRTALPKLKELHALGCRRMLECTPNFLGRDPELLARLADASGLEIWSNTGLYGAGNHKYLPSFARQESAAQLAKRWISEAKQSWKPRFIKIGVNRGPLGDLDRKLVHAAARTSMETGLTIASHTGDGAAAVEQLDILTEEKLPLTKFVWVHAQSETDGLFHERVARAGAWVEFDGVAPSSLEAHVERIQFMAARGLISRTLISQDAGWYHVGEPDGGEFRGYTYVYSHLLPRLDASLAPTLLWDNPRAAFGK